MSINIKQINEDNFIKEFGKIPEIKDEKVKQYVNNIYDKFWLYQSSREIGNMFQIAEINCLKKELKSSSSERENELLNENKELHQKVKFLQRKLNLIFGYVNEVGEAENEDSLKSITSYPVVHYTKDEVLLERIEKFEYINEFLKDEKFKKELIDVMLKER